MAASVNVYEYNRFSFSDFVLCMLLQFAKVLCGRISFKSNSTDLSQEIRLKYWKETCL